MARGYDYNAGKIRSQNIEVEKIPITDGQLCLEFEILKTRVAKRDTKWYEKIEKLPFEPEPHPIFRVVEGSSERWETSFWRKSENKLKSIRY